MKSMRLLALAALPIPLGAHAGDKVKREGMRMGSLLTDLKSPTGKEEEGLRVFSKRDADGKELCGKLTCETSPEDSED